MPAWAIWLVIAALLAVSEMLMLDMFLLMLAGGALGATVASLLGAPIWAQGLVFAVVSIALIGLVRPWAKQLLARSTPDQPMNVKGLVGRDAVVTHDVSERDGRIKLAGEKWSARTEGPGYVLTAGTEVRVVAIEGATAIVEPISAAYYSPY